MTKFENENEKFEFEFENLEFGVWIDGLTREVDRHRPAVEFSGFGAIQIRGCD